MVFNNLTKKLQGNSSIFRTLTTQHVKIYDMQTQRTYEFELDYHQNKRYTELVRSGKKATQAIKEVLR